MPLFLLALLQEAAPAAPAETPRSPFPGFNWIPILVILGIFYFVLIMPERKKQKHRQRMLDALKKGDRVMTSGGMYGTVVTASNDVVVLQVADDVRLRFARAAIQTIIADEGEKETPVEQKQLPSKA
jgi:preprotein translocase subunit YajC